MLRPCQSPPRVVSFLKRPQCVPFQTRCGGFERHTTCSGHLQLSKTGCGAERKYCRYRFVLVLKHNEPNRVLNEAFSQWTSLSAKRQGIFVKPFSSSNNHQCPQKDKSTFGQTFLSMSGQVCFDLKKAYQNNIPYKYIPCGPLETATTRSGQIISKFVQHWTLHLYYSYSLFDITYSQFFLE